MFPLGSLLFPAMPTALRIFEPRYLEMFRALLEQETAEFGVVLIERGFEAGGGDHRFSTGTVARVVDVQVQDDVMAVVAVGGRRFEVESWLPEEPFPRARVLELPDLEWDDALEPARLEAEILVRRELAARSEESEQLWPADTLLSEDPMEATWQLAGLAPVGPLDQLALLRATSADALLAEVCRMTREATEVREAWGPGLL